MAITFKGGHSEYNVVGVGAVTIAAANLPSISDEDTLIAWGVSNDTGSWSWPSGFTQICSHLTAASRNLAVAWKEANSESGDYVLDGPGSAVFGQILVLSGCKNSDLVNTYSNTAYTTNDTILRAAGVTTNEDYCLLLMLGWNGSDLAQSDPSGFNDTGEEIAYTYVMGSWYRVQLSAGATGVVDSTLSSSTSNEKHAFLIAISPEPFVGYNIRRDVHVNIGLSCTEFVYIGYIEPEELVAETISVSIEVLGVSVSTSGGKQVNVTPAPSYGTLHSPSINVSIPSFVNLQIGIINASASVNTASVSILAGYLSVMDYGATGNGTTDDTTAVENCMAAAAGQQKVCYFPSGTYRLRVITPPNNVTIQGAGTSSILRSYYSNGSGYTIFWMLNRSGITIRDLKFYDPDTTQQNAADRAVVMSNTHYCNFYDITMDGLNFGLWFASDAGVSTNILVDGLTTGSYMHTPLLINYVDGLTVNDAYLDSFTGDPSGMSHHIYIQQSAQNVTFNNCTLTNGSNYSIQIYEGTNCSNITFNDLTFDNVGKGAVIIYPSSAGGYTGITFNRLYGRCDSWLQDDKWFNIYQTNDVLVDDFDLDGRDAVGIAETHNCGSGEVVFSNGIMTNCSTTYYNYTPKGFKTSGGSAATSTNNTVNT